jgi:hypothetical protein
MQFDERLGQVILLVQLDRELVYPSATLTAIQSRLTGLVLVSPSQGVDAKRHGRVNRAEHQLEEHEADQDGLRVAGKRRRGKFRVKAKGRIERAVVDEDGEHDESEEQLRLRDEEEFGRVRVVPVS